MPSAQPARFARRHLHSVRADPATLTRAFAAPLAEPGGAASLLAMSVETRRRDAYRESPGSAIQSFNAARASPADAHDAGRARLSAARLLEPPVAPRMNSTAHVAHMAQMPNTTNHFSISPVL
jgi:hypothetical protein